MLASDSDRSSAFLDAIFRSTPPIEDTAARRSQLNIFYIPIKGDKSNEFAKCSRRTMFGESEHAPGARSPAAGKMPRPNRVRKPPALHRRTSSGAIIHPFK
jgi:hypothetical protein